MSNQSVEWRKGDVILYGNRGNTYLGLIVTDAGDIKPLALAMVSGIELKDALCQFNKVVMGNELSAQYNKLAEARLHADAPMLVGGDDHATP